MAIAYKEAIENFLNMHDIQDTVTFAGSLNRAQLARFFRLNHVFVFPSIFPEAFGIVQAEAMASGLALISSGVGGSKELVEEGINGLSFTNNNAEDLAQKLSILVRNPHLIKEFGSQGEKIVKDKFSVINAAKKLELLFKE